MAEGSGLQPGDRARLASEVRGRIIEPDDAEFHAARAVWNARFDRRPAAIVRCMDASDVAATLRYARERDQLVAVRGGGHDYAGNSVCEGGIQIDLSALDTVTVDASARRARVGAGVTWGVFDAATQAHGLATPGGTVSSVGVGGFTLGGGEGWLTRKHGLACDNLVGAEVVTAAGEVVRASHDENPDLFWALRGGGGNFGVVTSFEYELHEVGPEILAGQVLYPFERAPEMMRLYRDHFEDAPDELNCFFFILRIPPIDVFPEAFHGKLAVDFVLAFAGPLDEGQRHMAPFRELGDPILDVVMPQPYVALQQAFDAGMAKGSRWYSRSHQFEELSDEAIDTLVAHIEPFPGEFTTVYLGAGGGAVGRRSVDATAYPHRSWAHELHAFPGWSDPAQDEAIMAWARRLHDAMTPFASGGVYVNLLGEDEGARVRAAYGPNYDRLARIKAEWDPDNVFRQNHNVVPRSDSE